jgi:phytanoyl-CoA hydroxylase
MLSREQQARFRRDGFIVLPVFRDARAVAALTRRARQIVEAIDATSQRSVFSTRDQAKTADAWFLGSGDQVRCFFEEEAFDAAGRLAVPKVQAINKIGHALHDLDPVFERFSHGADLAELARDLGLLAPKLWQSMLIFKQPGIGGEVRWHQDATYLFSTPQTVTGFWFALEDATRDNGCLWVEPGGHRGPLRERFVREGDALRLERMDPTPWPDLARAQPVEVGAGSLVCLHGLLPHYSAANRSPQSRMAYTLHAIDGRSRYAASNWLQRGADLPLRGFE